MTLSSVISGLQDFTLKSTRTFHFEGAKGKLKGMLIIKKVAGIEFICV